MLKVENLTIRFEDREAGQEVVKGISFSVKEGEILGIVGESGSGKTMTALTVMGLLKKHAFLDSGNIYLENLDLLQLNEKQMRTVQGNDISMIFQEPMTSLNPSMRIGRQLGEAVRLHKIPDSRSSAKEIKSRVLEALVDVKLPEPERIYESYPHELSGGMRQRVMIAMGPICRPGYLLCDEPTTALDVTTQKGIIELIRCMKDEHDMGIVFITHDLKLLKNFADKVIVMCRGRVVESGTVEEIFTSPRDEYTRGLIAAIPDRSRRIAGAQDVRMDTI